MQTSRNTPIIRKWNLVIPYTRNRKYAQNPFNKKEKKIIYVEKIRVPQGACILKSKVDKSDENKTQIEFLAKTVITGMVFWSGKKYAMNLQ